MRVPRAAAVPRQLTVAPFVGSAAVAAGLVTRRQLTGDAWRRLLPDIYAWRGLAVDHRLRCRAAGLYLAGRGAVSGRDAAALWGAEVRPLDAPVETTVPHEVRFRAPAGIRVVRSRLARGDITGRWGVPVTTASRTAFDLARRLSLPEAVVCVDAMLAARLIIPPELPAFAAARPGWPGLEQLHTVVALADRGAESPQESRLRMILIAGGLPRPVTQYEVRDHAGRQVARLDLAYPRARLGMEYDGDQHRTREAFRRDLRRLNALRVNGWSVLRFTAADLRRPVQVVATVRAALTGHPVTFPGAG